MNSLHAADRSDIKLQLEIKKHKAAYYIKTQAHYAYQQEQMWQVLGNYTSLRYLLPRIKKSQIVWEKEHSALVYLLIDSPWPWRDIWTKVLVQQDINNKSFQWQQQQGMLKDFSGKAWLDQGKSMQKNSIFYTDFQLNMGNSIPKLLQTWALKYYIPKILKQLAHKIE
ncbi:MAG TPA: hypothetical protein PKC21_10025 [Oligoflexia bacterium]|nr:hypothetical protein [Oligoflexia bacterium]